MANHQRCLAGKIEKIGKHFKFGRDIFPEIPQYLKADSFCWQNSVDILLFVVVAFESRTKFRFSTCFDDDDDNNDNDNDNDNDNNNNNN